MNFPSAFSLTSLEWETIFQNEGLSSASLDYWLLGLVAKKLRVMVRTTKGDDILAACGQLKIKKLSRAHESV